MIRFSDVSLTLGHRTIFSQLNADFSESGISFLVGANGVGKSQLLRMVHGLTKPDSGEITVPPSSEQAFLFQTPILLKRTVAENLAFIRGRPACSVNYYDAHYDEVIEYFELRKCLEQQAMTLSGGQKKRVAIARLFLQQASCYLIDEPGANIDYHSNLHIEAAIINLAESDKKVIVTSHDLLQIERLFHPQRDEVLVLYDGNVAHRSTVFDFEKIKPFL